MTRPILIASERACPVIKDLRVTLSSLKREIFKEVDLKRSLLFPSLVKKPSLSCGEGLVALLLGLQSEGSPEV